MSVRRAARLAALLAAFTTILVLAAPAFASLDGGGGGGGTPAPLAPDQAQALAAASDQNASGSSVTAVDGSAVLSAAGLPGADTSIESGLSPLAAVGLATFVEGDSVSSTRPSCWANAAWHQWGTWPYQQRVTDTTYWCAIYGSHITYRTSSTTGSGTLCGTDWRASQLIGGGVGPGFTYFTVRSSAGFSCQTVIPWITLHTTHHQDVKRGYMGGTFFVGTG